MSDQGRSIIVTERWGLIPFREAWERQRELAFRVERGDAPNTLVLCQHPTVITIGKNGTNDNVLAAADLLHQKHIEVIDIDRGGDVTVHNPGQLVGYPIFNLNSLKPDLHWFLRTLEASIVDTVSHFGIQSSTVKGLTGVWVEETRKICAIGIHCRKWVIYHGFALNVFNDLSDFGLIVPCGISDRAVTSIALETAVKPLFEAVEKSVENSIRINFSVLTSINKIEIA
ncbi:MAG: lipoyl(octanoyl) transferase LipB [bacterium]|nr:lipoyl(octanoyl) transferase LipB [bacterium]